MPFTLSHPAAVIPLRKIFRGYLPLSALVMGSLSPDFRYFLPFTGVVFFSHSLKGVVLFCLPLSLIGLLLYHKVVKKPVFHLLPRSLQQRMGPEAMSFSFLPLRQLALIVIAILLGALSHIAWDSFTHEHGWAVERWPFLSVTILSIQGLNLRVFKLLQYGSTLIGFLLLAYWLWDWFREQPLQSRQEKDPLPGNRKLWVWASVILSASVIGLFAGYWASSRLAGMKAIEMFVIYSAVASMAVFAAGILFYSFIFRLVNTGFLTSQADDRNRS